jgi:hypothetical protein
MSASEAELKAALLRADKLIQWMSQGIGRLAPGSYSAASKDYNEHCIFMHNLDDRVDPDAASVREAVVDDSVKQP